MHHYHKLQEIIHSHPVGAPRSEEFPEILKILFRPDEVVLAVLLDFKLQKASDVAHKAGIPLQVKQRDINNLQLSEGLNPIAKE